MVDIPILNFDKNGKLVDEGGVPLGSPPSLPAGATDVVLVVHGWHEDQDSAAAHYGNLLNPLSAILADNPARWNARNVAYFGVIWPSDEYSDDLTVINMRPDVGGQPPQTLAPTTTSLALPDVDLLARARSVAVLLGADPDTLATQALCAAKDPSSRDAFITTLKTAIQGRAAIADTETNVPGQNLDQGASLFTAIGNTLHQLATGVQNALSDNPLIDWLSHIRQDANALAAHLLNTLAYNELKIRAGVIGQGLASQVLDTFDPSVRIHLVGHSFGARVMTAAAASAKNGVANLTLLEGAFSQNALSEDTSENPALKGAFQEMITSAKVKGHIAACCSHNDTAVWIAYPLASRVFRDTFSLVPTDPTGLVFGGPSDRYGAIGANGPLNLAGVMRWTFTGDALPGLQPGVHALECGSFVSSHTDVWKQGCAYVIAAGLLLGAVP